MAEELKIVTTLDLKGLVWPDSDCESKPGH